MIQSLILGILDHFRHFRHFSSKSFSQSGLAYVAILVLLAIMSTLALAFLAKIGTLTLATTNRLAGMQANYLAESAANHALWRLLNDPGFPADQTVYYMHNLDGGRYGYKVRKPTRTTFATVATVGAAGAVETHQSYVQYLKPANLLVYDKSGEAVPKYRQLVGASWSAQEDTLDDGPGSAKWVVVRGCPKRKEFIMGTLDNGSVLNFAVWDGTAWGSLIEFSPDTGSDQYRCFDVAYEQLSGDALVVGCYDSTTAVKYNVWDGSAWASANPQDAFSNAGGSMIYTTMASKPNSDEILIATVTDQNDLKVIQWNGSAFTDQVDLGLGVIDAVHAGAYGIVDIVYEQQSGDALIIWSRNNSDQFYYAVWNGTTLSSPTAGPDFGKPFNVVRAAAEPTGDYIFIAALDSSNDLNMAVWNGSTWIDSRKLNNITNSTAVQVLDVAWELSGQDVLVVWPPQGGNNVEYFSWQKGTVLLDHAVQTGPGIAGTLDKLRLGSVSGTPKIIVLAENNSHDLTYSIWTGNEFGGSATVSLETDIFAGFVSFGIAESGITYTGGSG